MDGGLQSARLPEYESLARRIRLPLKEGRTLEVLGQPYDTWICLTEVKKLILHKERRSLEENQSDAHEKWEGTSDINELQFLRDFDNHN